MAQNDIRDGFNQMAASRRAAGHVDAAARAELLREWFTNPEFRAALADHLWSRREG